MGEDQALARAVHRVYGRRMMDADSSALYEAILEYESFQIPKHVPRKLSYRKEDGFLEVYEEAAEGSVLVAKLPVDTLENTLESQVRNDLIRSGAGDPAIVLNGQSSRKWRIFLMVLCWWKMKEHSGTCLICCRGLMCVKMCMEKASLTRY